MRDLPVDHRERVGRRAGRSPSRSACHRESRPAQVATTPGMAETLSRDWRKAAWFYARYGVTEGQFCRGIPVGTVEASNELAEPL
jgi:hypothetical protein